MKYHILAIALLLALVGCQQDQEIVVGATLALTGSLSFVGEQEMMGMQLAVNEINDNGGIQGVPIRLIVEDNAGDSKQAVSSIEKFIHIDDVDVIFSAFTHITDPIAPIVHEHGKLMIYQSSVRAMAEGSETIFRDYFDAEDMGFALGKKLHEEGHNAVSFITEQSVACQDIKQGLMKAFTEYDIMISEEYAYNQADELLTILTKINQVSPKVIVTCTWRDGDKLMDDLEQLNMLNIQTYQVVAPFFPHTDTEEVRELYERNNAISTWFGITTMGTTDRQKAFVERFIEEYGTAPSSNAAYIYDDVHMLAQAFESCDVEDIECVSHHLRNVRFQGIAGQLSFNELGVSQRETLLVTVEDGVWVQV